MDTETVMQHPVCLIQNQDDTLSINQEAAQILNDITQPVVVIAIVGKYGTGKSYLMNKLVGRHDGFALASSIQAKTKGIWMWCLPHPTKPGHTLVLLDTEGLGDVEKGNGTNDAWIFSLAVLLSSTLVYNSLGTINQHSIDDLHYVTELSERIKLKSSPSNAEEEDESAEFKRTFPSFIWCVRDFSTELELDGRSITDDEFLDNSLRLKKGHSRSIMEYNLPRECIHHFFHSHKCFVFKCPASKPDRSHLDKLSEDQLDKNFVRQAQRFSDYVCKKCNPKTLSGGHIVTGRMLGALAVSYVTTIKNRSVPCLENAILAIADMENTAAIHEAMSTYETEMSHKAKTFPTKTLEMFMDLHNECEKKAVEVFMSRSFKDDKREYQVQFMRDLNYKFEEYSRLNEEASNIRCRALIRELSANLEQEITNGYYHKSGGYKLFVEKKQNLLDAYNKTPGKGIKSQEILQEFLQSNKMAEATILKMDESLTEKERKIEKNRVQREATELELQLELENKERMEKIREEQDRRFELQAMWLKEKMEEERLKMLKENEWMIEQKLKEIENMKRIGLNQKADILEVEVENLKKQNVESSPKKWIFNGVTILAEVASLFIPGVFGKAVTLAARLLRRLF